jgi:hypothetical protein
MYGLPYAEFYEAHKYSSELCADVLYRVLTKSDNKCSLVPLNKVQGLRPSVLLCSVLAVLHRSIKRAYRSREDGAHRLYRNISKQLQTHVASEDTPHLHGGGSLKSRKQIWLSLRRFT